MQRIVLPLVLLLAWPGSIRAQAPGPDTLRLRPGDAVRLQIEDEPGLAGDYPITEDGTTLLPLIGLVRVAGRAFPEVRAEIVAAYGGELRSRSVVVVPVLRIAVLGEVRRPGLLPVDPTFTMADLLAAAGGLTPLADRKRITLMRDGVASRLSLDAPGPLLDRPLRPGDQILVGRQSWFREHAGVLLGAGASVVAAALTSLILR